VRRQLSLSNCSSRSGLERNTALCRRAGKVFKHGRHTQRGQQRPTCNNVFAAQHDESADGHAVKWAEVGGGGCVTSRW
jgi:hypothetical protein